MIYLGIDPGKRNFRYPKNYKKPGSYSKRNCWVCDKKFEFHKIRFNTAKYCSNSCRVKNANELRIWDESSKLKISLANKGRLKGNKNPNWQGGGISFKCNMCAKKFGVSKNEIKAKKKKGMFCSRKCWVQFLFQNKIPSVQLKIQRNMRKAVNTCLKNGKLSKKWSDLVGYGATELMAHLEEQFKDGMTWGNYPEWHIDHIVPLVQFNFKSPEDEDFKRCWDINNLQPLWATENLSKGGKIC